MESLLFMGRSKTALKSPQTRVATDGSTSEEKKTEKVVRIKIPIRAINTDTKNQITILKLSQNKTTIRVSLELTIAYLDRKKITEPQESEEPGETTDRKP